MKHIKKKFLNSLRLTDEVYNYVSNIEPSTDSKELQIATNSDDYIPHFLTEKSELIRTFKFEQNGNTYLIPEPNPIVIYFSNAQCFLKDIAKYKEELFYHLKNLGDEDIARISNCMYVFFGFTGNYMTSLFNSLEAFINYSIPNDFEYKKHLKQKTEIYNKQQIQRSISLEDKIKQVLPQITNRSFHIEFAHKYETILQFKYFRDDIVHTKTDHKNTENSYTQLYSTALNYDYIETIEAVRDFINFYENGLIEECNCGIDE